MKKVHVLLITLIVGLTFQIKANAFELNFQHKISEDFNEILADINNHYVYLGQKDINLACIAEKYSAKIPMLKNRNDSVVFFENLLNEFYDSHVHLNTNTQSSYRLSSPIYTSNLGAKNIISSVWSSQLKKIDDNILGAEILQFNHQPFAQQIDAFPIECANKKTAKVREWLANKILAGRYNEPRLLQLKLVNGKLLSLDLDKLQFNQSDNLLSSTVIDGLGLIRINNSLGNNQLVAQFDQALNQLMATEGLILDLRNTVDGGNSYVARGIMGRFIDQKLAYQNHRVMEKYVDDLAIERSWLEFVSPRGEQYTKPVIILVGRWTGSMGEGMAIGFDGMNRAQIVGTEMERLAGAIEGFSFKHANFSYLLSTEKLFHVNGTPREAFVPLHYVNQDQLDVDQSLNKAIQLLSNRN